MPRLKAKNLAITTLAQELPSNADSCVVADASVLPDVPFRAVIGSGDNFEIVEVTAKDGNTLTLLRGLEGTTAQTWAAGTRLVNRLTAGCWDEVCRLIQLTSAEPITISNDTITVTQSFHLVDTEGQASSDDLATIQGGEEGDLLFLRCVSSSRKVVIKHGIGNIRIPGGQDFVLDSTDKAVLFLFDGTNWLLVGAAGGIVGSGIPGHIAKWISENEIGSAGFTESDGKIFFGEYSAFDEANNRLGVGTTAPTAKLHVKAEEGISPLRVEGMLILLPGWSYRKPITISNSGPALTDYQVLVTLDTASLINAGKMRSDCGDIRFTDSDGTTLLSYWIESGINTANTRIWVKVPSIPGSATKTIYVYYGNPNATSASNGDETFLFFDDFSAGNLNKWTILTGSWSIGTAVLPTGQSGYVLKNDNTSAGFWVIRTTKPVGSDNVIIEGYINPTSVDYEATLALRLSDVGNYYFAGPGQWDHYFSIAKRVSGTATVELAYTGTETTGWRFIHFRVSGNSLYGKSDETELSATDNDLTTGDYAGVYSYLGGGLVYVWQVRVRKYASPEPTTSVGQEETPSLVEKTIFFVDEETGNVGLHTTTPAQTALLDLAGSELHGLRIRPRSAAGAPTSGTWEKGTMIVDANGVLWICTASGTPGTWQKVGAQ